MKSEVVTACVAAIALGQTAVLTEQLGVAYDAGASEATPASTGLTQADVDAAVAAAKAADAQALADAQAKAGTELASLQSALDSMTAKEQLEEKAVAQVQASVQSVQAAFDAIKALLAPAPTPSA